MAIRNHFLNPEGVKKKSGRQEARVAKGMGGKTQKGSGSVDFNKGDVKTTELLIEAKRTDKDSLSVKKEWLEKITREAIAYNKVPALSIEFDKTERFVSKDWIAVPVAFLNELISFYRENAK